MDRRINAVFMVFTGFCVLGFALKWMGYLNQWLYLPFFPNILDLFLLVGLSSSLIFFGVNDFYGWKVKQQRVNVN